MASTEQTTRLTAKQALGVVALITVLAQGLSATLLVHKFEAPNASSEIARNLASEGRFEGGAWRRLLGPDHERNEPLRMFHLPGEPLLQAFGLRVLPSALQRYLHVPITVLLICATSVLAYFVGGPRLALATGLVANVHPFVLLHGPTWDDITTGVALDTAIVAGLALWLGVGPPPGRLRSVLACTGLAVAAAGSVLTRSQSRPVLLALVLGVLVLPRLVRLRLPALAVLLGMVVGLGAWGARNYHVLGRVSFGSSHDGITLWESIYPHAFEAVLELGQTESLDKHYMQADYARTASLDEMEADAYFVQRATRYMLEHPIEVLSRGLAKTGISLIGWDPSVPALGPRNVVAVLSNVGLLGLALAGLVRARLRPLRWTPAQTLIGIYAALSLSGVALMLLIGPVGLRYLLPADWVVWMAAASLFTRSPIRH